MRDLLRIPNSPQTLMVQGCTSDAGKSMLVTALCRWFARQSVKVAPFKAQNMALNSAVTEDGGEIGRSTALQALACGVPAHTDMNPVLLKPHSDTGAQVIIRGKVQGNMHALDYQAYKRTAKIAVNNAWQALSARFDLVVAEGAGSPAEINLRENDIANMGFAEMVDCPVILIADIDRGGVFAHLVGTLALLSESEQQRVRGFVINRFRGDLSLLQSGLDWLEAHTGKPVLGVLPYLHDLTLDAEDAIAEAGNNDADALTVVVPVIPHMSNHNDFDPLRLHRKVKLIFVRMGHAWPAADLIILPGSKATRADLAFLRQQGWDVHIERHLRYGGKVLGICGGYQMLGQRIDDPQGLEGEAGSSGGLGWLPLHTTLAAEKKLANVEGVFCDDETPISGYEIHNGVTAPADVPTGAMKESVLQPWLTINSKPHGAMNDDDHIRGCYLHGLFDTPQAMNKLLAWAGLNEQGAVDYQEHREKEIDRLADMLDAHLDKERLMAVLG